MSKFGDDLIESLREACEHAEGKRRRGAPDVPVPVKHSLGKAKYRFKCATRSMALRLTRASHARGITARPILAQRPRHSQFRVHVVEVPNVRAIRRELGMSQMEFATKFRIPLPTLKDWEQRRHLPDAPASAYLYAIARCPDEISDALESYG